MPPIHHQENALLRGEFELSVYLVNPLNNVSSLFNIGLDNLNRLLYNVARHLVQTEWRAYPSTDDDKRDIHMSLHLP